jgi:hypothetical protein
MEQQFKLTAPSVSLDFQVDENGWCKLFLHERGRAIVMGAGDRKDVIARLLRTSSEDDSPQLKGLFSCYDALSSSGYSSL